MWLSASFFSLAKLENKVPILTFSFVFIRNKFIYYWIIHFQCLSQHRFHHEHNRMFSIFIRYRFVGLCLYYCVWLLFVFLSQHHSMLFVVLSIMNKLEQHNSMFCVYIYIYIYINVRKNESFRLVSQIKIRVFVDIYMTHK